MAGTGPHVGLAASGAGRWLEEGQPALHASQSRLWWLGLLTAGHWVPSRLRGRCLALGTDRASRATVSLLNSVGQPRLRGGCMWEQFAGESLESSHTPYLSYLAGLHPLGVSRRSASSWAWPSCLLCAHLPPGSREAIGLIPQTPSCSCGLLGTLLGALCPCPVLGAPHSGGPPCPWVLHVAGTRRCITKAPAPVDPLRQQSCGCFPALSGAALGLGTLG